MSCEALTAAVLPCDGRCTQVIRRFDRVVLDHEVAGFQPGSKGMVAEDCGNGLLQVKFSRVRVPGLLEVPRAWVHLALPGSDLGKVRFGLEQLARRFEDQLGAQGRVHAMVLRQLIAGEREVRSDTREYQRLIYNV